MYPTFKNFQQLLPQNNFPNNYLISNQTSSARSGADPVFKNQSNFDIFPSPIAKIKETGQRRYKSADISRKRPPSRQAIPFPTNLNQRNSNYKKCNPILYCADYPFTNQADEAINSIPSTTKIPIKIQLPNNINNNYDNNNPSHLPKNSPNTANYNININIRSNIRISDGNKVNCTNKNDSKYSKDIFTQNEKNVYNYLFTTKNVDNELSQWENELNKNRKNINPRYIHTAPNDNTNFQNLDDSSNNNSNDQSGLHEDFLTLFAK